MWASRALAPHPAVILADEPTSALDPQTTQSVLDCLKDINQRFGVTIVIVTHEMQVVRALCQRAAVLSAGRVVDVVEVQDRDITTHHPQTRALLEEA